MINTYGWKLACSAALLILLTFSIPAYSVPGTTGYRIKYVSTEYVYLDGGIYDGLSKGDTLALKRPGQADSFLKIVYISESSAACQIITPGILPERGEYVIPVRIRPVPTQRPNLPANRQVSQRQREIPASLSAPGKRLRTLVSGSAAAQWYHVEDLSAFGYGFEQPGFRLTLGIRNLGREGYNLDFRFGSRQIRRSYRLSPSVRSPWKSRLYSLWLGYDLPQATWNWQMGRIVSNQLSGLGVVDGVILKGYLGKNLSLGVLGGTEPKWIFGDFAPSYRKGGVFLTIQSGESYFRRIESSVALAGSYHGAAVNREFIYAQTQLNWNRLTLYQSAEIDLNRDWRLARAREKFTFTSMYVCSDVKLASWLTAGFSYDDRRQILTYEQRSLADSLFDAALRVGVRGRLRIQMPWQIACFFDAGLRDGYDGKRKSLSYSGGITKSGLLAGSDNISIYATSFSNEQITGLYQSLKMTWMIRGVHSVSAGMNRSTYVFNFYAPTGNQLTRRVQLDAYIQLPFRFFLNEQAEYAWGSEAPGYHLYAEMGYRF